VEAQVLGELQRWLEPALRGEERAARRYARAWRLLVRSVLEQEAPDAPAAAGRVLEHLALTAPFSPWVAARGPADGSLAAVVSELRGMLPGMTPLPAPRVSTAAPLPDDLDYTRFSRFVLLELSGAGTGLQSLLASWELSVTDLARLFGVRRQAVQQWLQDGVPPSRQPKLAAVLRIADLLERNLLPQRIPAVVRSPSPAYGDVSMLDAIAGDRHGQVLQLVRRSFDWSWSA
jgi:transcriptional regulator with XRE-family HTH domain